MTSTLTEQAVEQNLDLFLIATAQYEAIVNPLMERLARQLGVDVSTFSATVSWHTHKQTGLLKSDGNSPPTEKWAYFFHGYDCGFSQGMKCGFGMVKPGIEIEARLGFGPQCENNFGLLDPGFFLHFIRSTERFASLTEVVEHDFHNTKRALEQMEAMGFLRLVKSDRSSGRLLTDLGRQRIDHAQAEATNEKYHA